MLRHCVSRRAAAAAAHATVSHPCFPALSSLDGLDAVRTASCPADLIFMSVATDRRDPKGLRVVRQHFAFPGMSVARVTDRVAQLTSGRKGASVHAVFGRPAMPCGLAADLDALVEDRHLAAFGVDSMDKLKLNVADAFLSAVREGLATVRVPSADGTGAPSPVSLQHISLATSQSAPRKFSMHVHCTLSNGAAFADFAHAGRFVQYAVLPRLDGSNDDQKDFITQCVDSAIYRTSGTLRVFASPKATGEFPTHRLPDDPFSTKDLTDNDRRRMSFVLSAATTLPVFGGDCAPRLLSFERSDADEALLAKAADWAAARAAAKGATKPPGASAGAPAPSAAVAAPPPAGDEVTITMQEIRVLQGKHYPMKPGQWTHRVKLLKEVLRYLPAKASREYRQWLAVSLALRGLCQIDMAAVTDAAAQREVESAYKTLFLEFCQRSPEKADEDKNRKSWRQLRPGRSDAGRSFNGLLRICNGGKSTFQPKE